MTKKFILASLASAVTVVILNGAIYPFYDDFLENNSGLSVELFETVQRSVADTQILATIISMILAGCLVTTVIYWAKARTFVGGLGFGFLFAVLMIGTVNLGLIATTHYYSYLSGIVDVFVGASTLAVAGGVAAVIIGRPAKPAME